MPEQAVDEPSSKGSTCASWRWAFNGAEPVSPGTMARFASRFARYGFGAKRSFTVYGLAECVLGVTVPRPGARRARRSRRAAPARRRRLSGPGGGRRRARDAGSSRAACRCPAQVRIADAAGRELPERHEGRVQFRARRRRAATTAIPAANRGAVRRRLARTPATSATSPPASCISPAATRT